MRDTRSNGAPSDASRERPPQSTSFEAARVGGARVQTPVLLLGFLVVVGAIVTVGLGGQSQPAATRGAAAAVVASSGLVPSTAAPSEATAQRAPRATAVAPAPVMTSGPGPIQLVAQRSAAGMFVHGDVFVARVTWVYVSLSDDAGNIAGWASVSVPGAAGPGRSAGPSLRFDVELALPAQFADRLWISAHAYDVGGTLIAGTRLEATSSLRPRLAREP